MSVLATKAGQAKLATGGYVVMAQGNMAGKGRWFLVAMITNVSASAIKDDSLEIVDSVHIDLQNLRVAGRVNLTDWIDEPKDVRYIGFLKQRNEVSEYFKLFLGCKEFIGSKEETKKLVKIVTDFAKKLGVDAEKQELVLRLRMITVMTAGKATGQSISKNSQILSGQKTQKLFSKHLRITIFNSAMALCLISVV